MTRDTLQLPTTRSWRDIPQPTVPRVMSREGRLRLVMATIRIVALVAVIGLFGWGVWLIAVSVRESGRTPEVAKGVPMKPPELRTDGVLDEAWLHQTLAIPPKSSLQELDLAALRSRIMADQQVVHATLTRHFPDRLLVQITERTPVARVMTEWVGQQRALLVARDGIIYAGTGYDPALLQALPWMDGVAIKPEGGRFRPIEGMGMAAELLAKARLEAEHLYENWNVISLAHLGSDRKLEVRAKDGSYVVYFTTTDDYFRQLAKLNYICDQLVRVPNAKAVIDLSLGEDVPVALKPTVEDLAPATKARGTSVRSGGEAPMLFGRTTALQSESTLFVLPHSKPKKTKREL